MKNLAWICLLLAGCGQTSSMSTAVIPVVHAQAPPTVIRQAVFPVVTQWCPDGCVWEESPGYYLAIRVGPRPMDQQITYGIVLPYDLHVARIDVWMGSGYPSISEEESRLQILKPNGQKSEFFVEHDKHGDVEGQRQRQFPMNIDLPAGTQVIVTHQPGLCIVCPVQTDSDTVWRLYSE